MNELPKAPPLPITAIILTFNEEIHIARCIERIAPLVERIILIDSYSTDRTVDIARGLGAQVHQHAFVNQAAQFQWALDTISIASPWILRLDADEYLEPGLMAALREQLVTLAPETTAIEFKLKVIFKGRWIRWGGYYQTTLLRLWRTGIGFYEQRWMDERVVLRNGTAQLLTGGDLVDENLNHIGWWTDKHNRYATRQMVDFINREYRLYPEDTSLVRTGSSTRRWRRFLRNKVFGKTPLYIRSLMFFFYRYFIRLGFIDGKQGFVWHFLQGCWFYMLVDVKIDEARSFIRLHGVEAFKRHLRDVHKIDVTPTVRPQES